MYDTTVNIRASHESFSFSPRATLATMVSTPPEGAAADLPCFLQPYSHGGMVVGGSQPSPVGGLQLYF